MNLTSETDWLGLLILFVMLIGSVMVCYYLITDDIMTCTSDPVKYLMDKEGVPSNYSEVRITAYLNYGDVTPMYDRIVDNPLKPRPKKSMDILLNISTDGLLPK